MPEARIIRLPVRHRPPPTVAAPAAAVARLEDVFMARGGAQLLDGARFSAAAGCVTALMGPNGAGKSLSLRLLAGLERADEGRVVYEPGVAAAISLVFQRPVLLRRSVRANLEHALALAGLGRAERRERVDALLATAGLADLADRPARRLSGGEQQRVAMLRALALAPRLLLLDEPTASLDPRATAAVESLVADAVRQGTAVLLVTHDAGQAARLASRIVFLNRGRVAEESPAETFFRQPASPEARAYLDGRLLV